MKFTLYTDGGSRNNPGHAGAGAVIKDESGATIKKLSKYLGIKTNNWAEYEAVIMALEALKSVVSAKERKSTEVEVKLDSQLIAEQLSRRYQIKEESLFSQFIKAHNLLVKEFPNTTFTYIPREENKEADQLANEAMDEGTK